MKEVLTLRCAFFHFHWTGYKVLSRITGCWLQNQI